MTILTHQKQDNNLVTHFLRSINYQSSTGNKPYGNTLNVLSAIFEAAGQKNLLYLVKLRKLWFEEVDTFLAKNSYPRNISVLSLFKVNNNVIQSDLPFPKLTPLGFELIKCPSDMWNLIKECYELLKLKEVEEKTTIGLY